MSIDGFCLVVRVSALAERFPGGVTAFLAGGEELTACSDGKLARIAFMHRDDLARFGAELDEIGFGPSSERPADWACVSAATGVEAGCEWIDFGRYGGIEAAWLRGSNPEPLVIPPQWTTKAQLDNGIDRSRLRFVSRDGAVETWEHIDTGARHYITRHDDPSSRDPAVQAKLEARYEAGVALIVPSFELSSHPDPRPGFITRFRLKRGLRKLESLVRDAPNSSNAHWFIGIARRILGEPEAAYAAFRRAYLIAPNYVNYCREYVLQCMATGRVKEAVDVAERIAAQQPQDIGLLSNFGLALLVAGDVARALEVTRTAHEREPSDPITKQLLLLIEEVAAGRRDRPTRYPF